MKNALPILPPLTWLRLPAAVVSGLFLVFTIAIRPCRAADSAALSPVPAEVIDALKSLKTVTDFEGRKKVYALLSAKGDARLRFAMTKFQIGLLLLRDDRLMTLGDEETVDGKKALPLIDAFTKQKILDADGKPISFARVTTKVTKYAIHEPAVNSEEMKLVLGLIAKLALLDPDPVLRIAGIRDCAERAAQSMPNIDDSSQFLATLDTQSEALKARLAKSPNGPEASALQKLLDAISSAKTERPKSIVVPAPSDATGKGIESLVTKAKEAMTGIDDAPTMTALDRCNYAASTYLLQLEKQKNKLEDLPKTEAALKEQLEKDPNGPFASALRESITSIEVVTTNDPAARTAAIAALGGIATSRAANLLDKILQAAMRTGDQQVESEAQTALRSATHYQTAVHLIEYTFEGLSAGSILVLLALGLSIIFGLMGVINMAQGEFMTVGAFTTLAVSRFFDVHFPGAYSYYLLAAVPAAFLVSAAVGFIVEMLVIRHLYGRPLETLLATWGVGLVLIWEVRNRFGNNVSIRPPDWMVGGWEVATDIVFPLNRVYIILFCAICIAIVYFVINGTKMGLLLRATTQNRDMAAALGVATRRVDGLTFAFGAGLAGLAGVAVPMYDNINPEMGQRYIVDCFMVVVVGGVGKLAGAIWAGLGLGFVGKYLEPILGSIKSTSSGASVLGKVFVLVGIIAFLQWRPQGLFPPKGRNVDA